MFGSSSIRPETFKPAEISASQELLNAYESRAQGKSSTGNKVIILEKKDDGKVEVKAENRSWSLFFGFEKSKFSFSNLVNYTKEKISETLNKETKTNLTKHLITNTREFESKPLTIWTRIFSYDEAGKKEILNNTINTLKGLGYDYKAVEDAKKKFINSLVKQNIKPPKSFAECIDIKWEDEPTYRAFLTSLESVLPRRNLINGSKEKGFDSEYLKRLDNEYGF